MRLARAILFSIFANSGVALRKAAKHRSPIISKITRDEAARDQEKADGPAVVVDWTGANKSTLGPRVLRSGPICASISSGQRVVSMADQHGDFIALVTHMHALGLLSRVPSMSENDWSNVWAGGDTIFVQTGDILDRGDDGKAMYKFLWAVQDQAPDGHVILLTGNHELMVMSGDLRYVSSGDFATYGGESNFRRSWDLGGEMGSEFRERFRTGKMKLTHKINGVVFTHAGLVADLWNAINLGSNEDAIEKLNGLAVDFFAGSTSSIDNSNSPINGGSDETTGGPMWTRLCYEVDAGRCSVVTSSLSTLNASRMVIGHCRTDSDQVEVGCAGSFLQADTSMAIYYSGSRSAADRQMAALEFYSGDGEEKAWVVYSGTGECQQLPTPGTPPAPSPSPPSVRRRRRNSDMWACRRRSSNPSSSDYGYTPDGYVCSGSSIVPESS